MPRKRNTALYFTGGIALDANSAILCGHLYLERDEPSVTRTMFVDDGEWFHLRDLPDVVYASVRRPPSRDGRAVFCFLGRGGLLAERPSGGEFRDTRLPARPWLMDLREIDGVLHACGTQNQVLRGQGSDWQRIDQGIVQPLDDAVTACLNAIDGFGGDEIYAVGDGGAILHWDGRRWTPQPSGTDLPLYCVRCAADGHVYAGGAGGVLLRGDRRGGWVEVGDRSVCADVLEDLAEFDGRLYVAAVDRLLEFDGRKLRETAVPVAGPLAFLALDACEQALWTVGDDCVLRYDGREWRRFACPEN
ncbi:WD40/YVTN/BNR-like repeat-containing protein [Marilutibacter chinensis]|uniref:Uncharacterized protein n=1 Tax=Marilutibacter chinensis TaxID=2912247 RepID=A0ABS9HTH6_9GAMM|nr:hypothetical protein [Lysobacter chinensis]MCF7222204.1 hypothetical protein [Lysobacter chinensis]